MFDYVKLCVETDNLTKESLPLSRPPEIDNIFFL